MNLLNVYAVDTQRAALEFLFDLMRERERENQANISFKLPTWAEHVTFVSRRPYRHWYIIVIESGSWTGSISATNRNEIGIVLLKRYRGHGIGPAAVRRFIDAHQPLPGIPSERSDKWLANIAPSNEPSRKMFERLGFKIIQHTYAYEEANHGTATTY